MNPRRIFTLGVSTITLALGCLATGGVARADMVTYVVTADTSPILGTTGSLDFQFNPATMNSLAATATVTAFASDGVLGAPLSPIGDVSGSLVPGPLILNNSTSTNDFTQGFTFGSSIIFDITLSGLAVGSAAPLMDGSTFAFTLFDASGSPLSTSPGGSIVTIDINGNDGSTTGTAYPPVNTPGPTATVTLRAVPEPSAMMIMASGLALMLGWSRLRKPVGRRS